MGTRLQEVEAAMLDIHRSLKRSRGESSECPSPAFSSRQDSVFSSRHDQDRDFSTLQDRGYDLSTFANNSLATPLLASPTGHLVEAKSSGLGIAYFGPTSLESLMLDFQDIIFSHKDTNAVSSNDARLSNDDTIDSFVNTRCCQHLSTAASPTEPPLGILECMIEPYFSNINPHFPIWSRDGFLNLVTCLRQRTTRPEDEWASTVCCNNLILINLIADSIHSVQRKKAQPQCNGGGPCMTLDLIGGFLANAKRAIENLGLLAPRLINLQALLSLCVVAQQQLSLSLLDFLFSQTVRCAEALGIFQWHRLRDRLTESEFSEYRNTAHCIYIMDKQIAWTAGVSPRVSQSEVRLDLVPSDGCLRSLAVKAELAAIEETIFIQVYAGHVKARTEAEARDIIQPINQRLDDWLVQAGVDVDAASKQPERCPMQATLLFSSLCARLLLTWPFRQHPGAFDQQHHSIAVMCVRLLVSLWEPRLGDGQHVSVPLLIVSYPPLYLLEICSSMLTCSGSEDEKRSLHSFMKLLGEIPGSGQDLSYAKRLASFTSILVDATIAASQAAAKRRRTTTSVGCFSRPTSSCNAFQEQNASRQMTTPTDNPSLVCPRDTGADQQYAMASQFGIPNPDDPAKSSGHTLVLREGGFHLDPTFSVGDDSEEDFGYLAFMD